jgi:hypothetical protein
MPDTQAICFYHQEKWLCGFEPQPPEELDPDKLLLVAKDEICLRVWVLLHAGHWGFRSASEKRTTFSNI